MADEISMTTVLQVKSAATADVLDYDSQTVSADMASDVYTKGVQTIGDTAEALEIRGDQATAGVGFFQNLDDNLTIDIGVVIGGTFGGVISLLPGECATGRVKTLSLYAVASSSGGANLKYRIHST